jgi:hypothetical protein
LIRYLQDEVLPEEKEEATRLKKTATHYAMLGDKLYKRGILNSTTAMRGRVGVTENCERNT